MDTNERALILIFCRNAVKGRVKTRLAATVGDDEAFRIYELLCDRTIDAIRTSAAERAVCYDSFLVEEDRWSAHVSHKRVQIEGDLGVRLFEAFDWAFSQGFGKVVVIGTDCPGLSGGHLDSAIEALDRYDAVIGPAADGGYYLLGLKQTVPELFCKKNWGGDAVFRDTVADLQRADRSCFRLPVLHDVDREEDLIHLAGNGNRPSAQPPIA